MERSDGIRIVGMLTAAYPSWRPPEETLELYISVLAPLPTVLVEEVVMARIHSAAEFAPLVGALLRAAAVRALIGANRAPLTPEEAWELVQNAIRYLGYYRGPGKLGGSAATHRAVDAIGWQTICTSQNIAATRAHFMRLFAAFQEQEVQGAIASLQAGESLPLRSEGPAIEHRVSLPLLDDQARKRAVAMLQDAIGKIGRAVKA